jgi:phage terminase large subunit
MANLSERNIDVPEIFEPLFTETKRYKLLHGGRGSGKSETIARYLLLSGLQKKERVLCTREVQKSIKESVHQILKDIIDEFELGYQVTNTSIRHPLTGTEFIFHGLRDDTSKSIKSVKGITKCWVEEAQTITKNSLDILIPTIREEGSEIIFSMNRTDEYDPVWVMLGERPDKNTLVIFANWYDNPFFPEVLKHDMEVTKNRNMNDYLHVWEGQPFAQGDNAALPAARIRQAMERKIDNPEGPIEIGVDVARGGKDRTSIYKRHGLKIVSRWSSSKFMRGFEIADKVLDIAGSNFDIIRVDDTGLGGTVTDDLVRRIGTSKVHGINFAAKDGIDKQKYPDFISHMYFEFDQILDQVSLPYDLELLKELAGRKYHYKNSNRLRQIETKDDFKKRIGRSPDEADALLLCFIGKPRDKFEYDIIF